MYGDQPVDELVDLLLHRVQIETRAVRCGYAELLHQRLTAVMAGANRDALHVENLRDVMRMDPLDVERDDACAPLGRRAVERDAGYVREAPERVGSELLLVLVDRLEAGRVEVVDGGAE